MNSMNGTPVLRDSNGRFLPGSAGGPGRKPRAVEREYLATLETVADSEAWEAICRRAVQDAIDGDAKARQWLAGYLLGQPTQRIAAEDNGATQLLAQLLQESPTFVLPPRPELSRAPVPQLPDGAGE